MNYEQSIDLEFIDIPFCDSYQGILLFDDQNYLSVANFTNVLTDYGYSLPTYEELLGVASSYARSQNISANLVGLMYRPFYPSYWSNSCLIVSSDIDFVIIGADYSCNIINCDMSDATREAFIVYDDMPTVYPNFDTLTGTTPINNYTYGYYDFTLSAGYQRVFDYSILENNQYTSNQFQSVYNRDNQISYNYTFLSLNAQPSSDGFYLSFGSPVHKQYEMGYQSGWAHGNTNGYQNGYNDGYNVGVNFGGNGVAQDSATAFSYVGNAFGAVGNIMSLEVLPNVTLGLCFSIPMVFILIMTIFKLVRK